MNKLLLAIDGSENSMKAVAYTGRQFSGISDLRITLFHVVPFVPAFFWDDGHILTKEEREDRKIVVDKWLTNRQTMAWPIFDKAKGILLGNGIKAEQIETKVVSDSTDIIDSVLEEAHDGGYQTLVLGRRGISKVEHLLMGSVTAGIVNRGAGIAICIVE